MLHCIALTDVVERVLCTDQPIAYLDGSFHKVPLAHVVDEPVTA